MNTAHLDEWLYKTYWDVLLNNSSPSSTLSGTAISGSSCICRNSSGVEEPLNRPSPYPAPPSTHYLPRLAPHLHAYYARQLWHVRLFR